MKGQFLVLVLASTFALGASAAPPTVTDAGPKEAASVAVALHDAKGKGVGEATLEQVANGLLVKGTLRGIAPGVHAFHVHQVGKCEAPFKSAGDHFNPLGRAHGVRADGGTHAGDLPNVVVPASGEASFELFAPGLSLGSGTGTVQDADGSALVLHAKADDYASQPAGNAGDRIACGVISAAPAAK